MTARAVIACSKVSGLGWSGFWERFGRCLDRLGREGWSGFQDGGRGLRLLEADARVQGLQSGDDLGQLLGL
jgi:hypothetical protein